MQSTFNYQMNPYANSHAYIYIYKYKADAISYGEGKTISVLMFGLLI